MLSVAYIPALNGSQVPSMECQCYRVSMCSSVDISALALNALRSREKASHEAQYCLIYSAKKTLETAKYLRKWVCTELSELESLSCLVCGDLGYPWAGFLSAAVLAFLGVVKAQCVGNHFLLRHWYGYPWYQPPPSLAFREVWENSWWWNSIAQENIAKAGMQDWFFFMNTSSCPMKSCWSYGFLQKKVAILRYIKIFAKAMIFIATSVYLNPPVKKKRPI